MILAALTLACASFEIHGGAGVGPPSTGPVLTIELQGTNAILIWTNSGYALQHASSLTGLFTYIPGANSPYTCPVKGPQQFFRLIPE